jgi:hypothetical protein
VSGFWHSQLTFIAWVSLTLYFYRYCYWKNRSNMMKTVAWVGIWTRESFF